MVPARIIRVVNAALCTAVALAAIYTGYLVWTERAAFAALYDDSLGQSIGPDEAPIVLVAIIDYRCPYCRQLFPVLERVLAENPDVRIIIKHSAIYGEISLGEARLALAAGKFGKFDEMHRFLSRNEEDVDEATAQKLMDEMGLNMSALQEAMQSDEIVEAVYAPLTAAARLNIAHVPAIIHDRVIYSQFENRVPTYEDFNYFLDQIRSRS